MEMMETKQRLRMPATILLAFLLACIFAPSRSNAGQAPAPQSSSDQSSSSQSSSGQPSPAAGSNGQGMSPTAILAGRSNIAYPPDVSGAVEAEVAFRNLPKPADWDKNLRTICEVRKQTLARAVYRLEELLDPKNPDGFAASRPNEVGRVLFSLAQLEAYQGKMEPAIRNWLEAYKFAGTHAPQMIPELEEVLGTAYLHKSEMENGAYSKPGDRCIFPPVKQFRYQNPVDSEKSVLYLTRFLARKPDSLEAKWLLNLAYMTLGKYPSGVPAKYLIPASAFASKESVGRFVDVAAAVGLNSFSMAGGVIVDDLENNGLLDVVTSSYDQCEPLHFFHNNGDGTFTDRGAEAGLADQLGGLNLIQTDYNNDGCIDIFVLRGGWQQAMRSSLLRNNCDGTFTDVTEAAGLADPIASQTAVWADIDNDGLLDLFVGNEQGPSRLYHNKAMARSRISRRRPELTGSRSPRALSPPIMTTMASSIFMFQIWVATIFFIITITTERSPK